MYTQVAVRSNDLKHELKDASPSRKYDIKMELKSLLAITESLEQEGELGEEGVFTALEQRKKDLKSTQDQLKMEE